jgi:membrane fusion protein (multidrug efflux system)
LEGRIESFAPASGAQFSLLPPDNATGNFTKIVQRVPVRVRVPAEVATQGLLRPGMSVVVSINTKPTTVAREGAPTPTRMAMPRVGIGGN